MLPPLEAAAPGVCCLHVGARLQLVVVVVDAALTTGPIASPTVVVRRARLLLSDVTVGVLVGK
jgi:hypothetical protein